MSANYEILEVAIEGETKENCQICKNNEAIMEFKNRKICKYCYMDFLINGDS